MSTSENDSISQVRLTAFRNALQELGWTEGRNVRFEVRWSGGKSIAHLCKRIGEARTGCHPC
jgi:hypothetical protein